MELKPYSCDQLEEMRVLNTKKVVQTTVQSVVTRIHSQILGQSKMGHRSYLWTNPGIPLYITIRSMAQLQALFPDSKVTRIGSNIKIEWA